MKDKHYTNEEIVKISKLLRDGRTYREIAMILNRDYTRLTRKINELELYRFKKIKPKPVKKTSNDKLKQRIEPKTVKMTSNNKLKHCNSRLNLYFNERGKMIYEITKYKSELIIKDFQFHNQGTIADVYAEMIVGILRALKYDLIFENRNNIVIKNNSEICQYSEIFFDNWLEDFLLKCKIQNKNYAKSEQFLKLIKKKLGDTRL